MKPFVYLANISLLFLIPVLFSACQEGVGLMKLDNTQSEIKWERKVFYEHLSGPTELFGSKAEISFDSTSFITKGKVLAQKGELIIQNGVVSKFKFSWGLDKDSLFSGPENQLFDLSKWPNKAVLEINKLMSDKDSTQFLAAGHFILGNKSREISFPLTSKIMKEEALISGNLEIPLAEWYELQPLHPETDFKALEETLKFKFNLVFKAK